MHLRRSTTFALDMFVIFVLAALLIAPLFTLRYSTFWGSIESSFISEARFLAAHWPAPGWNPLWYSGTRSDYVYAYGLRLGPAALTHFFGVEPVRAYHLYSAVFYAFGIATVYLLMRTVCGSRTAAWSAAAATALVSPVFLAHANLRHDAMFHEPIRLGVLLRYGEGPHISSIAWIAFALAFAWRALHGRRTLDIVLASLGCALVVWHNFYGATALAMMYAVLAWTWIVARPSRKTLGIAAAIPAAAYGLLAFWLVPSYFVVTRRNLQYIADPVNAWSKWALLAAVAVFCAVTWKIGKRRPERIWPLTVAGWVFFLGLEVLGHKYAGFAVWGSAERHAPELDIAIILAAIEILRRLWCSARGAVAIAATAAVLLAIVLESKRYVRHAWEPIREDPAYRDRIEYRVQDWVAGNMPNSRAFVSGSVRYWYDVWHDLQQVDGAQHPGILNDSFVPLFWEVHLGRDGVVSRQWLQLFGADLIAVTGLRSQEVYHDHQHAEKFAAVLPRLADLGGDTVIYGVPRRYRSLARVVETGKVDALGPIVGNGTRESLQPYVEVFENGPEAETATDWESTDRLRVRGQVAAGQSVIVQVSYDKPWRAFSGQAEVPVRPGPLGFIRVDAPPGTREFVLVHTTPLESIIGRGLTMATLVILTATLWRRRRVYDVE